MVGTRDRHITVPRPMHEAVITVAAERGVTFSDVVVAALDTYLPAVTKWQPIRLPGRVDG